MSIEVIDILWVTAGLGCDGNTIAMAAATQPSIQDIVLGTIRGLSQGPFSQSGPGDGKVIETRHAPLFAAHLT